MSECSHVKADGNTCKSPALNGEDFCYFHVASRDRIRRQRIAARRRLPLQLPVLEDAATIQLVITDVVNAMLSDRIDYKKAALALYALQTAAGNVKSTNFGRMENNYKRYLPERDPALPEVEPEIAEEVAEPLAEKKPVVSAAEEEVLPVLQASVGHANSVAPRISPTHEAPRLAKSRADALNRAVRSVSRAPRVRSRDV